MNIQTFDANAFFARSGKSFAETELGKVLAGLPALQPFRVYLAGGALRRTINGEPLKSDLDFFFNGADQFAEFAAGLMHRGYKQTKTGDFNEQYEKDGALPIQLIRVNYYATPADIIDSFDYTLCQFVFDGKHLYCGELSLYDIARKHIVVHKISYPVASMRRLLKYHAQGYYACSGSLAEILRQTASSPDLLAKLGAEPAYID